MGVRGGKDVRDGGEGRGGRVREAEEGCKAWRGMSDRKQRKGQI